MYYETIVKLIDFQYSHKLACFRSKVDIEINKTDNSDHKEYLQNIAYSIAIIHRLKSKNMHKEAKELFKLAKSDFEYFFAFSQAEKVRLQRQQRRCSMC